METKLFEIRDSMTCIPVVAIRCDPTGEAERYLLAQCGYGPKASDQRDFVLVARLDAGGRLHYDATAWEGDARTLPVAHQHIIDHWHEMETAAVVDVQYILGETRSPKQPQRLAY